MRENPIALPIFLRIRERMLRPIFCLTAFAVTASLFAAKPGKSAKTEGEKHAKHRAAQARCTCFRIAMRTTHSYPARLSMRRTIESATHVIDVHSYFHREPLGPDP